MSALVFVHGWGVRPGVFTELRDELRANLGARWETHAPALPTPTRDPYALDAMANALSKTAPPQCSVVGWSLGALVAIAWALARPSQVASLVLIAGTPCFVERPGWAHAMEAAVFDEFAAAVAENCEALLLRFAALQALGDAAGKRVTRCLRENIASCGADERSALAAGLYVLRESDLRERLAALTQPVLLVHGEEDRLVPLAAAEYLVAHLPRARLERIPEAAHAPFVSQPARVAQTIAEFLDER